MWRLVRDKRTRCQSSGERLSPGCGYSVRGIVRYLVLLGLTASLVSCVEIIPTLHFIQPSTQIAALVERESRPKVFLGTGEGEVCSIAAPFFPPFLLQYSPTKEFVALSVFENRSPVPFKAFQDAVHQAVESKQGTGLEGFTADLRVRHIYLFAQVCVRVKGMVVRSQ